MTPDRDWTVLLVGGVSTTGKSTLARALGAPYDARVVDADLFWMALRHIVPREVEPDLAFFVSDDCWSSPVEDLVALHLRVSRYISRALEALVVHFTHTPAIIEGTWILPELAAQKLFAGWALSPKPHALFLNEASKDELEHRLLVRDDHWRERGSPAIHEKNVEMQWRYGLEIKAQAEALGLPVLESRPFDTLLDRALASLASTSSGVCYLLPVTCYPAPS